MASSQVGPYDQNRMTLTNSFPQTQIPNQYKVNSGNRANYAPYDPQINSQRHFGGFSSELTAILNNQNSNSITRD